ncbi:DNA polymerase III subunit tau [Candidatus Gullanella endobia]|uniref:DNA polymerase III subunit gamma/tau n=1 Tax=Candidatus Gullanella endobia TaxID=1070130 RepID=A0A143WQ54_9ENTR|nr:DNA polymerase III subunit gamma/tau [Candidatus Gullanella endobia]CUX95852.1 DNA polymerase III subunit tau [Candidatus Gullanella endobia]
MSYQVLARKWRPKKFSDIVSQEHVLTALENSLSLGRIHHAYLLSGTRGIGKTTIARLLAKGLNCKIGITATPCGQCKNCLEIDQGCFIDLIEIDAASRTKVEDTRELLDNIQYSPAHARFKVYLIDEVHMLSRHSFNALLKTLEEPPAHVKFLLATTDPQKLPITLLSRCLQFYLKLINVDQIQNQLSFILKQEKIVSEPRALQLLARAANGSMRDALNLTEQAIAIGYGEVNTDTVSLMLGTINIKYPLALLEALANADGNEIMSQLSQYATHNIDWEGLLIEMLRLVHRLALYQLIPNQLNNEDDLENTLHLRDLSRRFPPTDLQLYYQILLIGRKELPFAPDPRMGVEMTLLRAMAFQPNIMETVTTTVSTEKKTLKFSDNAHHNSIAISDEIVVDTIKNTHVTQHESMKLIFNNIKCTSVNTAIPMQSNWQDNMVILDKKTSQVPFSPSSNSDNSLSDVTTQVLLARTALLKLQEDKKIKKNKPVIKLNKTIITNLNRFTTMNDQEKKCQLIVSQKKPVNISPMKVCQRYYNNQQVETTSEQEVIQKALCTKIKNEKTPELAFYVIEESLKRDPWAAQVNRLMVPKPVKQLALNTWREDLAPGIICLHLRSFYSYLNSTSAKNALCTALSADFGFQVKLTVIEDDSLSIKTPLEWRQTIYEEKLIQSREVIINDVYIQMLQYFFDAELDKDSICPL